jgi:tetratricopeptide (TPR) repeat protein
MMLSSIVYYVRFGGRKPGVIGRRMAADARLKGEADPNSGGDEAKSEASVPGRIMSDTFSRKDVAQFFDISEGRLRYWERSGFLAPTGHDGKRGCYTFQDLISIRTAKTLLENNVSLQRVRRILDTIAKRIPRCPHPVSRLRIMSDSKTVVVVDEDCEFEADTGQLLLDFKVRQLEEKVVAELPRYKEKIQKRTAYEWYLEGCRLDENEETLAQAEEAYHKAIHIDPTLANAYTNLGNLLYRNGHVEDAKVLYSKAIEVDKKQPEAYYNLGFIEFEQANLKNAQECFITAVKLDSTFADAHFNLAMTLYRLNHYDRARYHWQHYLKLEPKGPWADVARQRLREMS